MMFKALYDALEQVALNWDNVELSDEELEEAFELAKLAAEGLQHMREKRFGKHEREDEVQAPEA